MKKYFIYKYGLLLSVLLCKDVVQKNKRYCHFRMLHK